VRAREAVIGGAGVSDLPAGRALWSLCIAGQAASALCEILVDEGMLTTTKVRLIEAIGAKEVL
jgi:hypothetical protein